MSYVTSYETRSIEAPRDPGTPILLDIHNGNCIRLDADIAEEKGNGTILVYSELICSQIHRHPRGSYKYAHVRRSVSH